MMKKRISLVAALIVLAMAVSLCPCFAAQTQATIRGETICVSAGQVDYSVHISGNPGLMSYLVRLKYDTDVFSLAQDPDTGTPCCVPGSFTGAGTLQCTQTSSGCSVMWYHTAEAAGDGSLFTVRLQVAEDAPLTDYDIRVSVDPQNTIGGGELPIAVSCVNGSITLRSFDPAFLAGEITTHRGAEIKYPICIQDDPGLAGFHLSLGLDTSWITPVTQTDSVVCEKGGLLTSGTLLSSPDPTGCRFLWFHDRSVAGDGELFRVSLKIDENAPFGAYPVTLGYIPEDTIDEEGDPVPFKCISGVVNVLPIEGDLNGDGAADVLDMACLYTYLSTGENEGTLNEEYFAAVADVNGDGSVNILDYQALYEIVKK